MGERLLVEGMMIPQVVCCRGGFQGHEASALQRGGAGGAPDAGVLGRSPSRSGFTSANHLLNFQYERSQVGGSFLHDGSWPVAGRKVARGL